MAVRLSSRLAMVRAELAARGAACSRMSRPGSTWTSKRGADRPRALAPGQEDRRRVVDDRPLERCDAGPVRVVVRRMRIASSAASTAAL